MTQSNRGYTAGKFALEIDNCSAGWVFSAEGGNRVGEVVIEKLSQEHHVRKHIGGVKYEDITIVCGIGMSKGFWEKLKASFDDNVKRFDGAIHICDYDGNIKRSLEFHQALVTEIGFPALDASSKDAAKLTLKLSPEWTNTLKGSGRISVPEFPLGKGQQKRWLPSNFRLRIDGLEKACEYVNKIEALTFKQKIVENVHGEVRWSSREPAGLELPNLVLTTAEIKAAQFYQWEKDFLINGKNSDDDEKTGTLEYLSADLQTALFTIDLMHLGIFKLTADKMDAHNEAIRRVKAEMYFEDMRLQFGNNSTWA
jgi:hypothetical protein